MTRDGACKTILRPRCPVSFAAMPCCAGGYARRARFDPSRRGLPHAGASWPEEPIRSPRSAKGRDGAQRPRPSAERTSAARTYRPYSFQITREESCRADIRHDAYASGYAAHGIPGPNPDWTILLFVLFGNTTKPPGFCPCLHEDLNGPW